MFNLNIHKSAQITSEEKYLRQKNLGPKADDDQAIWEKELPHRIGDQYTTTEDQMEEKHKLPETGKDDVEVIEKVLNEAQSYVTHRSDAADLPVPAHNVLVEKDRQERLDDWKPAKETHWSQTFNEKKQQGSLPKFPKNPSQHDKVVLNNDPRRFEKGETVTPLAGGITTADIDQVAFHVKTGKTVDYDTAIVAVLREADKEKRELSSVEQKTISQLKIARTGALLEKPYFDEENSQ